MQMNKMSSTEDRFLDDDTMASRVRPHLGDKMSATKSEADGVVAEVCSFKASALGVPVSLKSSLLSGFLTVESSPLWNFASLHRLRSRMLADFSMNNIRRPTHCLSDFAFFLPPYIIIGLRRI